MRSAISTRPAVIEPGVFPEVVEILHVMQKCACLKTQTVVHESMETSLAEKSPAIHPASFDEIQGIDS